ncbi:Fad dependent oxidoreductase [Mycena indigotica]|uniref:Fad dependent oxidoreductase n=1 Tax=Mycena indigotica TaxID=2126181 RepID=A0A8H6T9N2_9AGAR|nr:Fad dependent oxidoreductase [Mycena indigotica]KAF7312746.1 Fad dependent oxidoreductase [Mycena indigotica]
MAAVEPGFPRPNPTTSWWLQKAQAAALLGKGYRTTPELPSSSDVTIVGSGLSGAATAYFLLTSQSPPASVTLIEAREICDGATGRNGGHCRPDCYRDYTHYKAEFGKEQALKIIQNEMDTLDLLEELVRKEGIDCDFWRGFSYDVPMDEEGAAFLSASYEEFAADGGPVDIITRILDPAQAAKVTRCPRATASYKFPAGSLFPYKLVQNLLDLCVRKHGLNIQSQTPVRKVTQEGNRWSLHTDRGIVDSAKVVFAMNAFTSTLLPEFSGHIWPFKGQCSAVLPPKSYLGNIALQCTYSLNYGDYLIQRPSDDIIIFGGARRAVPVEQLLGNTDDESLLPAMTDTLKSSLPAYFADWAEGEGEVLHVWSGIMGYTSSGIPFVGEIHDKPGAFVCAGHHGHGMARILTAARGLAAVIQGAPWAETGLPECFQPSKERLEGAARGRAVVHNIGKQDVVG